MNVQTPPRIAFGLAVLTLLTTAAVQPAGLSGQESPDRDVELLGCSGRTPGFAVTEDLWLPGVFQPGETALSNNQIPAERDSTQWSSATAPGFDSGHEIFQSVDVLGDHLYVAYNAGLSIWNVGGAANAENPVRVKVRDGWNFGFCQGDPDCGPFLSFPNFGEVDFLVEDVDVLAQTGGPNHYIAVSGKDPVGTSLWQFNTSTQALTAIYQDTTHASRQVRLLEDGGTIYVFTNDAGGLEVYSFTQALGQAPCLEEEGAPVDCPGVHLGQIGTVDDGRYLDVLRRPSGEILVATTDGDAGPQHLELWSLDDPSSPGSAVQLFDGLHIRTFGVALFNYEGNDYLAALERDGSVNVIKIFNVNGCSGSACSLGAPVFDGVSVPPRISDQFLTFSMSGNTPFLYHGLFGALQGEKVEQLLDLTTLGRPGQNITEITDGGPTYFDTCQNEDLGYWAWYYTGNDFGFDNFNPRVGKFNGNYFYRAAGGMLDVHIREGEATPTITVELSDPDPQGLYWMSDDVTFEATGGVGCNPSGTWTWTPTTPGDVDAVVVNQSSNQITYRFDCTNRGGGRCADGQVSVSATNDDASCTGADVTPVALTVKDPSLSIESISPGGGTFTQCEVIDFEGDLAGRGPTDYAWSVDGTDEDTGTVNEEDLSTSMLTFSWDTATAQFEEIFADGFESGDTTAWSSGRASSRRGGGLPFEIGLALDGGGLSDSVTVELIALTGEPAFTSPPITATTEDNVTFDFTANTVLGTVSEWDWELEDDNGTSLCVFGMDVDVPCTVKSGQNVSHTWVLQTGTRRIDLTISNCLPGSTPLEESTTVMVESLEELEVTAFELDNGASSAVCDIDFDCVQNISCDCLFDETITFNVEANGEPEFFDFDWDGNGTFEDTHSATAPTTNLYSTLFTGITPRIRGRRGSATPAERDLKETLNIVSTLP